MLTYFSILVTPDHGHLCLSLPTTLFFPTILSGCCNLHPATASLPNPSSTTRLNQDPLVPSPLQPFAVTCILIATPTQYHFPWGWELCILANSRPSHSCCINWQQEEINSWNKNSSQQKLAWMGTTRMCITCSFAGILLNLKSQCFLNFGLHSWLFFLAAIQCYDSFFFLNMYLKVVCVIL